MTLQKQKYILANREEGKECIDKAKDWYNYQRGHEQVKRAGLAVRILAEYFANQDGLTIYKGKAEQ